jgi:transposase-like protein
LTTGEVAAHFADVYGATVSKDTISRITDKVIGEMTEWCNRPLEPVYPVVFIDAIHVKIRDGQVANRPIYVAIGSPAPASATSSGCGSATAVRAPSSGLRC